MTAQCRYRHCRRFIQRSREYCDAPQLCQMAQESRDAMSAALMMGLTHAIQRGAA